MQSRPINMYFYVEFDIFSVVVVLVFLSRICWMINATMLTFSIKYMDSSEHTQIIIQHIRKRKLTRNEETTSWYCLSTAPFSPVDIIVFETPIRFDDDGIRISFEWNKWHSFSHFISRCCRILFVQIFISVCSSSC